MVAIVNPDCTLILSQLKKQLHPQAVFLGNKIYNLVVLPLFAFRTLQVFLVQRDHFS